ncbi:diphthamide biosynthesis protein 2 [Nematocida sp. AWRm77]|nr:diphthamide biosynthesis protein 2 [Nematocida sp. AWRm77]
MQYFLSKDIKVVQRNTLREFIGADRECTVGIQVDKNSLACGEKVKKEIDEEYSLVESVVLADSDRCCADWVAVEHSKADYLLKESFACPLLGAKRNPRSRACRVGAYTSCVEYTPIPQSCVLSFSFQEQIQTHALYLAVDTHYLSVCSSVRSQMERWLGTTVHMWEYSVSLPENHLVLVLSSVFGFVEYFQDNTKCVSLCMQDVLSCAKLVQRIEEGMASAERERAGRLIQKIHLGEKIKKARVFGIVSTSAEHMDLVWSMSKYLDQKGKKFYHFFINGLKPQKLGNFLGVDVFVVVQCPFSSFRFEEAVVSVRPYDLVLGLCNEWDGLYTTNLECALEKMLSLTGASEGLPDTPSLSDVSSTERSLSLQSLEITSGCNLLKVPHGEMCTQEQAVKYFQTGEALKAFSSITIQENLPPAESSASSLSDALQRGYSGIPTNYQK